MGVRVRARARVGVGARLSVRLGVSCRLQPGSSRSHVCDTNLVIWGASAEPTLPEKPAVALHLVRVRVRVRVRVSVRVRVRVRVKVRARARARARIRVRVRVRARVRVRVRIRVIERSPYRIEDATDPGDLDAAFVPQRLVGVGARA